MCNQQYYFIVPAAGQGKRMGQPIPKQYIKKANKTILEHTLLNLLALKNCFRIVVALDENDHYWPELAISNHPRITTCIGGKERAHSVYAALEHIGAEVTKEQWVAVHDCVRPLVSADDINTLFDEATHATKVDGFVLGSKLVQTIKEVDCNNQITKTVDRSFLWNAETPQLFQYGRLKKAIKQSLDESYIPSDEASAIERFGGKIKMIASTSNNIKVTEPKDLNQLEFYMKEAKTKMGVTKGIPTIRIGHGYDVHAFEKGDHLMLGGVAVPYDKKFKAHSDGDVLIHALCDALLGALALGDIGKHFPDSDECYKNIDSRALLRKVIVMMKEKSCKIINADITIIAQKPKIAHHIKKMIENLANDCDCTKEQINIKATTTESLGFTGREEGIEANAVVLLENNFSA